MDNNNKTVGELLADRLGDHGVRYVYGIPGGASIPIIRALSARGIEFIVTSHESAAAVMADVTARLSGVTGVCHSTLGPGATNLSTGVGGALLDRSPLIALTTVVPEQWRERTTQMNIDHVALFEPLTKGSFALSSYNAGSMIDDALLLANEEYPGPVHIAIPADVTDQNTINTSSLISKKAGKLDKKETGERLAGIESLLKTSSRPLIALGLTAARYGLSDRVAELLKTIQVPVVVTPMAKGLIRSDNPCYAGVLFHALSDRLHALVKSADLVIGVGYDPVEYNYESWMPDVPLVHCDTIECDLPLKESYQFISSPDEWFTLLRSLKSSGEMVGLAAQVKGEIRKKLASSFTALSPVEVVKILQNSLPDNAIVTTDVGSHLHLMGQQWDVQGDGRFIITNGWSSMGFGLPAANAAALTDRSATVVCVTGDGGMMMSAGEVLTARRYGLRVISIVFADKELNLIKLKESRKGLLPVGVDLYKQTLFESDSFLGVKVIHAVNAEGFRAALKKALAVNNAVIIEVSVNPEAYDQLIIT